jgi:hypothetical protein
MAMRSRCTSLARSARRVWYLLAARPTLHKEIRFDRLRLACTKTISGLSLRFAMARKPRFRLRSVRVRVLCKRKINVDLVPLATR